MKATIVTLQRDKCIGCGYCEEQAPDFFRMNKIDGKSSLVGSTQKKGFFTLRSLDPTAWEPCSAAAASCPVKIIRVSKGQ